MTKRIIIFGGTGFIGKYIVERLANAEYFIKVFTSKANSFELYKNTKQTTIVQGSILDEQLLLQNIAECDVVINLIGILNETKQHTFQNIHVETAEKIAKAATAKKVPMLIHFSSMGVENHKLSKYAKSKVDGEKAVISAFPKAIVIKPSVVFGKEDKFFNKFAKLATILPFLPLIGGGNTQFQPIYVKDIAELVYQIIINKYSKRIYNVGGPEIYSFKDLLKFILKTTNRKCLLINIPFSVAKFMALFLERKVIAVLFKPLTGDTEPMMTRDQVILMQGNSIQPNDLISLVTNPSSIKNIVPLYLNIYKK